MLTAHHSNAPCGPGAIPLIPLLFHFPPSTLSFGIFYLFFSQLVNAHKTYPLPQMASALVHPLSNSTSL